jgi:dUTP pyrophosphatase
MNARHQGTRYLYPNEHKYFAIGGSIHKITHIITLIPVLTFAPTFKIATFARVMTVQVQIINKSPHELPAYQTAGSSGMDIRAWLPEPVSLKPMERRLIPTGLYMALPVGYEAQIRPRSGLAIKRGLSLVNTPGTIDSDYRGEIMVPLINLSTEDQLITDGERIAQMIVARYELVNWVPVEELDETLRGAGGFGHSGIH